MGYHTAHMAIIAYTILAQGRQEVDDVSMSLQHRSWEPQMIVAECAASSWVTGSGSHGDLNSQAHLQMLINKHETHSMILHLPEVACVHASS